MPSDDRRALDLLAATPYGLLSTTMRALPFITATRHIVADESVLLRLHRGHGYHQACDGNVVAYGAQAPGPEAGDVRSAQVIGPARIVDEPGPAELRRLGPAPRGADGDPYDPAYLRIEPQFAIVHSLSGVQPRHGQHSP